MPDINYPVANKTTVEGALEELADGITWEIGDINATSYQDQVNLYRIRLKDYIPVYQFDKITFNAPYKCAVFTYKADFSRGSNTSPGSSAITRDSVLALDPTAAYIRCYFMDGTDGAPEIGLDAVALSGIRVTLNKTIMRLDGWKNATDALTAKIPRQGFSTLDKSFFQTPLHIRYSADFYDMPANSLEGYITVGHVGYGACKGDVQPTSDGKMVMCHDSGFSIDSETGLIRGYNELTATLIHNMTYAECTNLQYNTTGRIGYNAKVVGFEQYIQCCKELGMIPFITIRDEYIAEILDEMIGILTKYQLIEHCIVNSFTIPSLRLVSEASNGRIVLSNVIGKAVTVNQVKSIIDIGNCCLNMFTEPGSEPRPDTSEANILASADAIAMCRENRIPIGQSIVTTHERYIASLRHGFSYMQLSRPFNDYRRKEYPLTIEITDGVPTIYDTTGFNRYTADVAISGDDVQISNIKVQGTDRDFPDAIHPHWFDYMPYRIEADSVLSISSKTVTASGVVVIKLASMSDGIINVVITI